MRYKSTLSALIMIGVCSCAGTKDDLNRSMSITSAKIETVCRELNVSTFAFYSEKKSWPDDAAELDQFLQSHGLALTYIGYTNVVFITGPDGAPALQYDLDIKGRNSVRGTVRTTLVSELAEHLPANALEALRESGKPTQGVEPATQGDVQ